MTRASMLCGAFRVLVWTGAALADADAGSSAHSRLVPAARSNSSPAPTPTPTPVPLAGSASGVNGVTGDCNQDAVVTINELVRSVAIALGQQALGNCQAADANGDARVSIDELIRAVNVALNGVPVDKDGDGFTESQGDCDDANPAIHPQAAEVCNGVDDDCDDETDEGNVCGGLPPDPADVAPPVVPGVATTLGAATEFLYTGGNPIQTGVAPGTIEPKRAAVLRGKVLTRDAAALSGVSITIVDHPELGRTLSRADGMFDLAVNGGGLLTVNYEKPGFCPVHRQVTVPWQDYAMAPDVVMIPLDPIVTPVTLGSTSVMQMAHGSMQSDANGTRTAMMMFMPGTSASLVLPDGTTQSVSSLHVRATEFTVGTNGPAAMPAVLPPTSAYTYCVEFSADEALNAGATTVAFSQPVINYVENFLDFPVGIAVPTGFYDRQKAAWVPSPNGRVVKILSITGGVADVDTNGDGVADSGLGITAEERQNLATLYAAGQTLWRVPLPHFSVVDENWSFLPVDATAPGQSGAGPSNDGLLEDPSICPGCVIEMENQVLGDSVAVVGTPYNLNYRSDRVPGRIASRTFTLSGPSVPASLKRIELHITIAGRTFDQTFSPDPNQQFTFVWDRQDAYGRTLLGGQPLSASIDYIYPVNYAGSNSDPAFSSAGGEVLLENPARQEFIISQPFKTVIGEGLTDARVVGLGGWTLDAHHFYDPVAMVLHTGDGRRRRPPSVVLDTFLPGGTGIFQALAVGADGSVYFFSDTLRRIAPDGTETVVAGGGDQGVAPFGDDGPAIGANLFFTESFALAPDGSIYLVTINVVRHIGLDGIIRRVAGRYCTGGGECPPPGPDGGLATETDLGNVGAIAVGPDGSVYIATSSATSTGQLTRIRRVGTDGIITTVTGATEACDFFGDGICGNGGPATQAQLAGVSDIAFAPDGSMYITDGQGIRRVSSDGIIERVAGALFSNSFSGDGGPAINATLCSPSGLAVAPDGSVYVADTLNGRIRRISPDGIISTIAGIGRACASVGSSTFSGDNGPALQAQLGEPRRLALAPDGRLYVMTLGVAGPTLGFSIRRVGSPFGGFTAGDIVIASEDGSELYVFDEFGRHLRTVQALTGATLLEFGYDADGRLTQVTEHTGGTDNVTTIEHDGAGNPTAIVGPFGQRTALAVDANGFLASISNPASEETQFTSSTNGLLASKTDPRGKTTTFIFDPEGRLTRDAAPAGGTQDLVRVVTTNAFTVTRTTALARTTDFDVENLTGNVQRRTITAPDGTQSQSTENIDAGTTHITSSDGTISDTTLAPDPRFGIHSPVTASFSLQFPSSLQSTAASARTAVLANSADPLSLVSLTETTTVEGRTSSNTYTAATRTYVNTTAAGRVQTVTLDALGRVVRRQHGNLDPSDVAYDDRGRLASLSVGSGVNARRVSFTYNARGFIETIIDPIGRTAHLAYDAAGRVVSKTLPDRRLIEFGYDVAGNVTSLIPPGRPAHTLGYSDREELTTITPPAVPGSGPTFRTYDADRQLTTVSRPDGQTITIGYDAAGRQLTRVLATGGVTDTVDTVSYDAAGRISSIAATSGVTSNYDYDGSLIMSESWTGPISGEVTSSFDAGLRLASQSINGTDSVAFDYDDDDLLIGVGALTISRAAQTGLRTGSGLGIIDTTLSSNGFGEVIDYSATASGAPLFSLSLARDALGRITRKIETIGGLSNTIDYSYDLAGQITNVMQNGRVVETYDYDGNGNRTNATVGNAETTAIYDDQDRLTQHDGTVYAYSGAGDLLTKTTGGQTTAYAYDQVGNLLAVTLPNGTAITYIVDGLDRRVGKKVNGILIQGFIYGDALRPLAELDGAGGVIRRFVYTSGNVPAYMVKGGDTFRLITDQIGTVRLVVNAATGAVVQRMDYDTFGNVLEDTNPGFQPFGFAGGIHDTDTKLVRLGARDYDAVTGRWTAKDPISFGGGETNLYRYVRNDPVNRVDPTGMGEVSKLDKAIAELEDLLQALTGRGGRVRPPRGGNTLSAAEQEQFLLDWRVKRETAAILEAQLAERRTARKLLQRRLARFGAVKLAVIGFSCFGLAERAKAEGVTPVQQFDNEGRRDLEADIQDVKEYFVQPIVDIVSGAFAGILQ